MRDDIVFDDTKLSDLFREIHTSVKVRSEAIADLIPQLIALIKSPGDASVIAPIVNSLYDTHVKSDEQIVKIATIVQRVISAESYNGTGNEPDGGLSEKEKELLRETAIAALKEHNTEIQTQFDATKDTIKKLTP